MYEKFYSIDRNELKRRLDKYYETSSTYRNTVVCVNCGSTKIDQNSLDELHCYNCNETLPWNGLRFTISRENEGLDDLALALRALTNSSYDEWHKQLESGLHLLLKGIISDVNTEETFTRDRLEKLQKEWDHCKKVIDMYFNDRRKYDEDLD